MKKYLLVLAFLLLAFMVACKRENVNEGTTASQTASSEVKTDAPTDAPTQVKDPLDAKIDDIIASMTLEEKVGQMFIVRCPQNVGAQYAKQYQFGGYILFANDFVNSTPDALRASINSYQSNSKIPMFISVDEEGGSVVRASKYSQFYKAPFDSPQNIYLKSGLEGLKANTHEKCELLSSLLINMNLAPVCDVADSTSDYIYKRSLGTDAKEAAKGIATIVAQMEEDKIPSVLKHFPGYGNNVDTHTGIAHDKRDMSVFENEDFLPFIAGIENGSPCIMISHNIVECMDPDLPASLSPKVIKIIREKLGFKGIIMTDSLAMQAIKLYTGDEAAAVLAVKAGNDMLCVDDYDVQIPAVVNAVKRGEISEERIEESVRRILKVKEKYNILK